jgi:hypothetical protein
MRSILNFVLHAFKFASYAAVAVVGTAVVIVAMVETFNLCPGFSANTGLSCKIDAIEGIANVAMGVVMGSLLSLVPAVLAIAGLIFAIRDLVRWRRRRRAAETPQQA